MPLFEGDELAASLRALRSRLSAQNSQVTPVDLRDAVFLVDRALDRIRRLSAEQDQLEQRVARIENSLLFRVIRQIGARLHHWRVTFRERFIEAPFEPFLLPPSPRRDLSYESWFAEQEQQGPSWEWHRQQAESWTNQPLISVVMAMNTAERASLEAAVKSVSLQSYPRWELCICADSPADWIAEFLAVQAHNEPRLRWELCYPAIGKSGAWNRAAEIAGGDYLAFLRSEDVLSPLALHYIAEQVRDEPADIIYTDEDILNAEGRLSQPLLKPDWSPDLLLSCMYLGRLLVIAKRQWEQIGGFRREYEDAQEYDAALRITDRGARVRHVPRVLYHSRGSGAVEARECGRRALEDAASRRRLDATVLPGAGAGTYYLQRRIAGQPSLGFVICSRKPKLLARCLESIQPARRRYDAHLVVVHHRISADDRIPELIRRFDGECVPFGAAFNFSRMNNLGAAASRGDILFFLNDDVVPVSEDWLTALLAHIQREEVGIAGAKLLYPGGAIQHAGVVVGMSEGVGHPGRGAFRSERWRWLDQTRNVSAVTGACLGIRRQVFTETGGFDPLFPVNYNDIDLCLRVRQRGYEVIYEPHAILRHDECQTRPGGTRLPERQRFHDVWGRVLSVPDPFYSPLLSLESEEIELRPEMAAPPRTRTTAEFPSVDRV